MESASALLRAFANQIKKYVISTTAVSTVAGTGIQGFSNGAALTTAQFNGPHGLALASTGILYIADRCAWAGAAGAVGAAWRCTLGIVACVFANVFCASIS